MVFSQKRCCEIKQDVLKEGCDGSTTRRRVSSADWEMEKRRGEKKALAIYNIEEK